MKEISAVEWLEEKLLELGNQYELPEDDIDELINKAKEMEKEKQQVYSEKEVIELLTQRSKHFGTSVKPFDKILLKQDLEWFEKFKKK
jgi:hypothetical protein